MLAARPLHQRSASCPPQEVERPALRRTPSCHNLSKALHQIDLVDLSSEPHGPDSAGYRKPRPRHARMWSLTKRKNRSLERHASLQNQASKAKRAKQGEYVLSSSNDLLHSSSSWSAVDAIPRSPSGISLLDLASPALKTANGYKNVASIFAAVSPTCDMDIDPARMYLEQAKKLERRLQAEAMRLGATAVANSTITSVEDTGSMAASGIAVIVTQP